MKICLIGSSRFLEMYQKANRELTLKGHIVYSIATVSSAAGGELPEQDKMVLDLVHLRKIQESEMVCLITDENGYYGFSTKREMIWANMIEKPIMVFVPTEPTSSVFRWGHFMGGRELDIPSPEKIAEGWRETFEAEAEAQRREALEKASGGVRIMTPGGEA